MTSRIFHAKFAGVCDHCDRVIHVGDSVCYHSGCVDVIAPDPTILQPRESICPACQLAHAGECA